MSTKSSFNSSRKNELQTFIQACELAESGKLGDLDLVKELLENGDINYGVAINVTTIFNYVNVARYIRQLAMNK